MKKSDFYYDLPEELIAQEPAEKRDHSRLLVLGRQSGEIEHRHFYDILEYFKPGDCHCTGLMGLETFSKNVPAYLPTGTGLAWQTASYQD